VSHAKCFDVQCPVESFLLIYLNPPYEFEISEGKLTHGDASRGVIVVLITSMRQRRRISVGARIFYSPLEGRNSASFPKSRALAVITVIPKRPARIAINASLVKRPFPISS